MKLFEFNEKTPLPLAALWLVLSLGLMAGGVLVSYTNPILLPLGAFPAMAGGLLFAHGIVPIGARVFDLLVKGVDRTLSFVFDW